MSPAVGFFINTMTKNCQEKDDESVDDFGDKNLNRVKYKIMRRLVFIDRVCIKSLMNKC